MFTVFIVIFVLCLLIRTFFTTKLQYDAHKIAMEKEIKENDEFLEKLKNLTPEQTDRLLAQCEEWLENQKRMKQHGSY